jgi:hypothetical protein
VTEYNKRHSVKITLSYSLIDNLGSIVEHNADNFITDLVTERIFFWVIYPLADPDNRLSSWDSGLIWNTGFQQNSVTDSQITNSYLSNGNNTIISIRDNMRMKPSEKEEKNIHINDEWISLLLSSSSSSLSSSPSTFILHIIHHSYIIQPYINCHKFSTQTYIHVQLLISNKCISHQG